MQYFPPALERLTEQFARLPGIGHKSAQRLAFFVLSQPEEDARAFADAIVAAKRSISLCPVCQNLTEGEGPCAICRNEKRDGGWCAWWPIPRMWWLSSGPGVWRALPCAPRGHLPHEPCGARRPAHQGTDGAGVRRRGAGGHHGHQPGYGGRGHRHVSVPSVEALWVRVTRLAYGVPVGGHLEYADDATLMRALEGRREM